MSKGNRLAVAICAASVFFAAGVFLGTETREAQGYRLVRDHYERIGEILTLPISEDAKQGEIWRLLGEDPE